MTYTPTRETLELAALACGKTVMQWAGHPKILWVEERGGAVYFWQPHLPTTQGKADLLDMVAKVVDGYDIQEGYVRMWNLALDDEIFVECITQSRDAALTEAAIKVAAMVGGFIRDNTMKGGM